MRCTLNCPGAYHHAERMVTGGRLMTTKINAAIGVKKSGTQTSYPWDDRWPADCQGRRPGVAAGTVFTYISRSDTTGGLPVPPRLQREKVRIPPIPLHQLLMTPILHHSPMVEHGNPIGHPHSREAV